MAETVAQLVAGAAAAAERAGESYAKGDLDLAVSASKVLLSFGSRLHSRLAAMRVSLQTARAGKSFRGRVYLPGLSRNSIGEDGAWTSGAVGEADAFVTAWRDAIQASAPVELIPSVHGLALPSDEPIVHVVGRTMVATQRRRVHLSS